jgi:hypothetical protein
MVPIEPLQKLVILVKLILIILLIFRNFHAANLEYDQCHFESYQL